VRIVIRIEQIALVFDMDGKNVCKNVTAAILTKWFPVWGSVERPSLSWSEAGEIGQLQSECSISISYSRVTWRHPLS